MGFTCALAVTREAVVSYTAFPPLPGQMYDDTEETDTCSYQHTSVRAVYFCCTGLGVTSTGRYPASCPVKPGLSSSAAFRHLQPRLSVLLNTFFNYTIAGGNCPDLSSIHYRNGKEMFPCETNPITLNHPLRLHPRSGRFHPQLLWPAHRTVHSADARHVLLPSGI